ncbi:KIF-binding protein [Anthonomus grandis grandis]|uniref:KIF-binding protein n=1 Tax=Anthonomus grandis grandis TaxID=2921223 RepID=UPI0021662FC6|nr:KIF-binding protein [Anthonomus grandis grandis]
MTINKEAFSDLEEKYQKVIKLLLEDSKSDPENEPYLSKYSARQILIGMKANIENLLRNQEGSENVKLIAMYGAVHMYLGMVAIDTEEISNGEKHLEKCLEIIEKYESLPEMVLVAMNMYNQFGILYSQRDPGKAKMYLERGQKLYSTFKESQKTPMNISELFEPNKETYSEEPGLKNMEKMYTLTLYYLAQIFGQLKENFKSAIYCHITLQRQLDMQDYDPIDWALNSATLSQFFMEKCGFKQARHHLSASLFILEKYRQEEILNTPEEINEEFEAKLETFNHRSADVARCWIKYAIFILSQSKERLLNHTENIDEKCSMVSDLTQMKLSEDANVTIEELQNLSFTGIDVKQYESEITDQFVLYLPDAKKVFLKAQEWVKQAQDYYSSETHASDYIEIVQDQSQLYLNLLFFEDNPDNQAKLHKRRVDLLEDVLNTVNPQFYMNYCRQIWFELGQSYSELVDIKSEKLKESNERPKPQALIKINNLVEKSISNFKNFLTSFKVNTAEKEKIQDDAEKPFLRAYMHVAAMYGRYITLDKNVQLKNVEQQYEHYKFIVDYCEKHPNAAELLPMELGICKEMVMLLPVKMIRLKNPTNA